MPSQTVAFDEEENKMIGLFKIVRNIRTKPEAIRQMIRIAFSKKEIKSEIEKIKQ